MPRVITLTAFSQAASRYQAGDTIRVDGLDLDISVEEIYEDVKFD